MNLQFTKDGHLLPLETVPWDDELNDGLIRLKVRAVSTEQEAERFALGLRAALRKVEREFGDGYFNAVLVDLITDNDLTRYPEIAESSTPYRPILRPEKQAVQSLSGYDRGGDQRPGVGVDRASSLFQG